MCLCVIFTYVYKHTVGPSRWAQSVSEGVSHHWVEPVHQRVDETKQRGEKNVQTGQPQNWGVEDLYKTVHRCKGPTNHKRHRVVLEAADYVAALSCMHAEVFGVVESSRNLSVQTVEDIRIV